MLTKTHIFIVREALKLVGNKFKGLEKHIEEGCIKEDLPTISLEYDYFHILGTYHFYHPVKKHGYFKFSGDAKQRGLSYFNKAVILYKKGDKEKALFLLGKSLHLLADVAVPSHTKLEFHLIDIFEHYINSMIPRFKFAFKLRIALKISPSHCFERLAKKSFRTKHKKNFFLDTLHLLGINLDKERYSYLHKISNKLLSSTIIYSAVLLLLFYSRVNKSKAKDKAKENFARIKDKAKR